MVDKIVSVIVKQYSLWEISFTSEFFLWHCEIGLFIIDGGRILVQQCSEFGAVNCQKKRGILIRIRITITYILYINLL